MEVPLAVHPNSSPLSLPVRPVRTLLSDPTDGISVTAAALSPPLARTRETGRSNSAVAGTMPSLVKVSVRERWRPACTRPKSTNTSPASERTRGFSTVTHGRVPRPVKSNASVLAEGTDSPSTTTALKLQR